MLTGELRSRRPHVALVAVFPHKQGRGSSREVDIIQDLGGFCQRMRVVKLL